MDCEISAELTNANQTLPLRSLGEQVQDILYVPSTKHPDDR